MITWFQIQPWPCGTSIVGHRLGPFRRQPFAGRACEDPGDVGVDHRDVAFEREREHRPSGVRADAGERQQRVEVIGKRPAVAVDDHVRRRRAGCAPAAGSRGPATAAARRRARRIAHAAGVGIRVEERRPLRDDPFGLGLLQHHLGDEDRPRVALASPRQVAQLRHAPGEDGARVDQAALLSRPRRRCRRTGACGRGRTRASRSAPCA